MPGQGPDVHIQERGLNGKESPKAYCSIVWRQHAEKWFHLLLPQVNDFKHSSLSLISCSMFKWCHQDLSFTETVLCNVVQVILRTAEIKRKKPHTFCLKHERCRCAVKEHLYMCLHICTLIFERLRSPRESPRDNRYSLAYKRSFLTTLCYLPTENNKTTTNHT